MKVSQRPAVKFNYPLVDRRMARHDCLNWMAKQGYPKPPRSACIGCPYHSNVVAEILLEVGYDAARQEEG